MELAKVTDAEKKLETLLTNFQQWKNLLAEKNFLTIAQKFETALPGQSTAKINAINAELQKSFAAMNSEAQAKHLDKFSEDARKYLTEFVRVENNDGYRSTAEELQRKMELDASGGMKQ